LRRLVWTQEGTKLGAESFLPCATVAKRRPMEFHREWGLCRKLPNALLDGLGRRSFLSAELAANQRQHRQSQQKFPAAQVDCRRRSAASPLWSRLKGFVNRSGGEQA